MILARSTIVNIIAHRLDGCGIRETARLCDVHRDTVLHWSLLVGAGCARLLDRSLRDLPVHRLELDELHTTIHTKHRRLRRDAPAEHGDAWLYLAECAVSRAIVCYRLGKRDLSTTNRFIAELRARIVGRPSITTDGYTAYLTAIPRAFHGEVDLATVVKEYEGAVTLSGRRAADMFVRAERTIRIGAPSLADSTTAHVERLNATTRLRLSKFARRSLRHAKSFCHLETDVALFAAGYNFVWVHSTIKKPPAEALGLTDRALSVDELVGAALVEPEPEPLALPTWATATRIEPIAQQALPTELASESPPSVAAPSGSQVPPADHHAERSADGMTVLEKRVLDVIKSADQITIADIAAKAFPELTPFQANSWVRNQLRGLRVMKLVEKVARGTYRALATLPGEAIQHDALPTEDVAEFVADERE
jgi:IS1 family transposase